MRKLLLLNGLLLVLAACLSGSCVNLRGITLMQGQFDTARLSQINTGAPVVQKGDILSIIVFSDNPAATASFNQTQGAAVSSGSGSAATAAPTGGGGGYQVDDSGYIQFPTIGLVRVEGLTINGVRDTLNMRLKDYLKNPYYTIRFMNTRFTLLGEVNHPGVFPIPGEKITLLEALGLAGDLTFYGRRDNVLFIRQNNGKREFARLDLTKPEIMASPYFYLQQNDVIIIESSKKRAVANDQVTIRNVTIAATVISTLAIIYSIFHN